jgi:LAS superfamily LD-carboxypeptidase LdcB
VIAVGLVLGVGASAVSGEALTPLDTAMQELELLTATVQADQPAISQLFPRENTGPVLTEQMAADAADAAGRAAEAASAGADLTADPLDAAAPTAAAPTAEATAADAPAASADPTTSAPTTSAPTSSATDAAAEDVDPLAARLNAATERVAALTAEVQATTQQTVEATAAAAAAAEAARKEEQRTSLEGYANGKIPDSALCDLGFAAGQQLRCDAAEALAALNTAFVASLGYDLTITDSYRSYAAQVACRRQKGNLCATPGTSNHGNGTAVDLGGDAYSFGTDEHDWMLAHAEEFGWTLPDWARKGGSKPEPWHWEYVG